MAVPAKKVSRSKRGSRRAHQRPARGGLTECPECGAYRLPHHICRSCGTYDGREVLPPPPDEEDEQDS